MPRPRLAKKESSNPASDAVRSMRRIAGHAALDFVNTIDRDKPDPEGLPDYNALLTWCETEGVMTSGEVLKLRSASRQNCAAAQRWLDDAHALRRVAAQLAMARATGERAPTRSLATFNQMMRQFGSISELVGVGLGYSRRTVGTDDPLGWPIVRLVQLTAELLTSPSFVLVSLCQANGCGWFFIDDSRGHRRRWCSMDSCGNREKARRHYYRVRV